MGISCNINKRSQLKGITFFEKHVLVSLFDLLLQCYWLSNFGSVSCIDYCTEARPRMEAGNGSYHIDYCTEARLRMEAGDGSYHTTAKATAIIE